MDIEEVTTPSVPTIEVTKGGITINCVGDQKVNIYDLSGRNIISRNIEGTSRLNLNQGIYLVNGEKIVIR